MAEIEKPSGPPPAWLEDFARDLRASLDEAAKNPDRTPFNPPEGVSLGDLGPGSVVAVFIKKPDARQREKE